MLQNLHLVIIFSFLFRLMSFNFFTGWSHFWRLPLHFTFGSFHLFIFTFLGFWARKAGDHLLFKTTDSLFLFHGFNYFWWKWIQSIRFKKDPIDGVNFFCFPWYSSTLSPAPNHRLNILQRFFLFFYEILNLCSQSTPLDEWEESRTRFRLQAV